MGNSDEEDPFGDDDEDFLELARRPPKSTEALIQTQLAVRQREQQMTQRPELQTLTQVNHKPTIMKPPAPPPAKIAPTPHFQALRANPESQRSQSSIALTQNDITYQASGQVSLLKAKNEQLVKEREQIAKKLRQEHILKLTEQNNLIKRLQESVRKLEDEQKFKDAELRDYRMKNKRRRLAEEEKEKEKEKEKGRENGQANDKDVEILDVNRTPPPPSKSYQVVEEQQPKQQTHQAQKPSVSARPIPQRTELNQPMKPRPMPPRIQIRNAPPKNIEENTMFIDFISSYCITGLDTPVMSLLNRIFISKEEFTSGKYTSGKSEALGSSIIRFLSTYKKTLRLNEVIESLIKVIIDIVMYLLTDVQVIKDFTEHRSDLKHNRHRLLAIPYLLSLLHCCLTYRPKAITNLRLIFTQVNFCLMLVDKFDYLLRPTDFSTEFYARSLKLKLKSIQYEFLESLIVIYSLDLIETLITNAVQSNEKFRTTMKSYLVEHQNRFVGLFRLIFANLNHSSVNLMFSVVNILNSALNLWEKDKQNEFPLVSHDLLKTFLDITPEEFHYRQDWLVYGLNRATGNNSDAVLIEELIPEKPEEENQVNPIYSKHHKKFWAVHNHQLHQAALSINILQFFEKLILFNFQNGLPNTLRFLVREPSIFKNLIMRMSRIQQFNLLNPRRPNNLNSRLTEVLAYSLKVMHMLKEIYKLTPQSGSQDPAEFNFPTDLSFELFIILSRISVPSREETCDPAIDFLLKYQQNHPNLSRYFIAQLPNLDTLATLNLFNPKEVAPVAATIADAPNGLEIAYDSETVQLATEILNTLLTPDEADMFYSAMKLTDLTLNDEF